MARFLLGAIFLCATTAPAAVPIDLGILIDKSSSGSFTLSAMVEDGNAVIEASANDDRTFVVGFAASDNIYVAQDLSSDRAALSDAVENMFAEKGGPALTDALVLGATHFDEIKGDAHRRKALVVLSSGDEAGAYYKLQDALDALKQRRIAVYAIVYSAANGSSASGTLRTTVRSTGGEIYWASSAAERDKALESLIPALRKPEAASVLKR